MPRPNPQPNKVPWHIDIFMWLWSSYHNRITGKQQCGWDSDVDRKQ
jgi:hypothetical protein